jgi:hypothetical protein
MAESTGRAHEPPLTRSDAWLLAALTEGSRDGRPVSLRDLVHDADWLNRRIPTFDQISYGLPRLVAAGFATVDGYRFRATPKAIALRRTLKSLPSDGLSDVIVRMEAALGAKPYPEPEDEDRSLGRLSGFEPVDLEIAVRKHGEWVKRWSRPLVAAAWALSRILTAMELSEWHRWWKEFGARQLRDLLMREWDPIGVSLVPEARDEYDGYLGSIAARLRRGDSVDKLAELLAGFRTERMGLRPDPARDLSAAHAIHEWYLTSVTRAAGG